MEFESWLVPVRYDTIAGLNFSRSSRLRGLFIIHRVSAESTVQYFVQCMSKTFGFVLYTAAFVELLPWDSPLHTVV